MFFDPFQKNNIHLYPASFSHTKTPVNLPVRYEQTQKQLQHNSKKQLKGKAYPRVWSALETPKWNLVMFYSFSVSFYPNVPQKCDFV